MACEGSHLDSSLGHYDEDEEDEEKEGEEKGEEEKGGRQGQQQRQSRPKLQYLEVFSAMAPLVVSLLID